MTLAADIQELSPDSTSLFGSLRSLIKRLSPEESHDADTCRARRDFILDKLAAQTDAFSCEESVACMMHTYPSRF